MENRRLGGGTGSTSSTNATIEAAITSRKETELKRLAKFYASDRTCRKRLRTLLEFLKNPLNENTNNVATYYGNIVSGSIQSKADKDKEFHATTGMTPVELATLLINEFWNELSNAIMTLNVIQDCVTELETAYGQTEAAAFRKAKRKTLEAEDWTDIFEALELLLRHTVQYLKDGWQQQQLIQLFAKLLKRDNHAIIKKYAFRCLALYTDATRNVQELQELSPMISAGQRLSDILQDNTSSDPSKQVNLILHLELLRESVDFSPYGGANMLLPEAFLNEGAYVDGWMRAHPTLPDEPVDMLKFLMDLSLEREDEVNIHPCGRFTYWTEVIMRCYMPLLYPKACIKAKFKAETDKTGFFHHCPGSLQRVVARWLYKLRSREDCMEALWNRKEFSDIIMETIRQRFAYRDAELVIDAVKFYSGICTGSQYIPSALRQQQMMDEFSRSMISHVSQLFHPSVQLEDNKLLLQCIDLLELIAQRRLDDYTSTYLRRFVIATIDNYLALREPRNEKVLANMLTIVFHVWMHASMVNDAKQVTVWMELTVAIQRWLTAPNDSQYIGVQVIESWKREIRFTSLLLMYIMDEGQSKLQVSSEGGQLIPVVGNITPSRQADKDKSECTTTGMLFLMELVQDVGDATLLLDRVLHLVPAGTIRSVNPTIHTSILDGFSSLIDLWLDSAICSPRPTPTKLHAISPSTVIALFGEWFLSVAETEVAEFQKSRCIAICMFTKLCTAKCANPPTVKHLTTLARILYKGITSPSIFVVSTVLTASNSLFTQNFGGMNVLVAAYVRALGLLLASYEAAAVEPSKQKSFRSRQKKELELQAIVEVIFSFIALPKQFPEHEFAVDRLDPTVSSTQRHPRAFYDVVGDLLLRILKLQVVDIDPLILLETKKKALWGLYTLIFMVLTDDESAIDALSSSTEEKSNKLMIWITSIIELCYLDDLSLAMAGLSCLQDLTAVHKEVAKYAPDIIPQIIINLSLIVHQHAEELANIMQSTLVSNGSISQPTQRITSEISTSRNSDFQLVTRPMNKSPSSSEPDTFSKLKNKFLPTRQASSSTSPVMPVTPQPIKPRSISLNSGNEEESPAMHLISLKSSAIFECLRFWLMACSYVLQDDEVSNILFSAIENAFIGILPDSNCDWLSDLRKQFEKEENKSIPLLLIGLQMRNTLATDGAMTKNYRSLITYLKEIATAAESLLLHLLHYVDGFPSPAGVTQIMSNCNNLNNVQDSENKDESLNFVFMDSMIITVVGNRESPCARFIMRDMTGLFTWEIASAVSFEEEAFEERMLVSKQKGSQSDGRERPVAISDNGQSHISNIGSSFSQFHANAAVRVEFKPQHKPQAIGGGGRKGSVTVICNVCKGSKIQNEKESKDSSDNSNVSKIEVVQVPWNEEQQILSNKRSNGINVYQFHDEPGQSTSTLGAPDPQSPASSPNPAASGTLQAEVQQSQSQSNNSASNNNHESRSASPKAKVKPCTCRPDDFVTVCGLFDMRAIEPNIGSLDDERCLLDLLLDTIPMVYRDCGGDTTDKTLLGGRYTMLRYNAMDINSVESENADNREADSFTFFQRLIHDEECYAQFRAFAMKDGKYTERHKDMLDFCDHVKKFERLLLATDRVAIASCIYWEYFTSDSGRQLQFPSSIGMKLQTEIQKWAKLLKAKQNHIIVSGDVFLPALDYVENQYMSQTGLMGRYVSALETFSPATANADGSPITSIPHQLALFDSFSIMEVNVRIANRALELRQQTAALTNNTYGRESRSGSLSIGRISHSAPPMRIAPLDICRLFLAQTGLLSFRREITDSNLSSRFKLLESGSKLSRSLLNLDQSPVRETMKIGVIYVAPGQRSQSEILKNEFGSPEYNLFLSQLGWDVDLVTHKGYSGGLDCNPKTLSNGAKSLYYADAHTEVMFHVVTNMPTKASDAQQIDKKRHVGNDFVHIVWCDNTRNGYNPSTISSQFIHVQLIITPLKKCQVGLFLVQVFAKDKVPSFGPLQSSMIVHQQDLGPLVRQTVMNANRVCRAQSNIYLRPYPTRKKAMEEIISRYSMEADDKQLLSTLFTNLPLSTSPPPSSDYYDASDTEDDKLMAF